MATVVTLPDGVEVIMKSDGHLACKTDNGTVWDRHIKLVVVNDLDVPILWEDITESFESLHKDAYSFMVPYMPEMEIFVQVELKEPVGTGRTIYLISPDSGTPFRVGTLFPGEGRNIVRNLIHQWFISQISGPKGMKKFRCEASSHNPRQQALLEAHLKNEAKALGEQWLLMFTKMCYSCNVIKNDVANFVPSF